MMNWKNGCVAILKDKDEPIGTGFVVSSTGIIVTCSHLLRPQSGGTISLRFTANNQLAQATVVEAWTRGREEEDIAFLRLTIPLPAEVLVLPLIRSHPFADRHFRCWGYPNVKGFTGLGADGHVVAQVQQNGHERLQFSSTQITKGYSGGPLWDKEQRAVIGVVNSGIPHDRLNQPDETGFATPSETLIRLCPELKFAPPNSPLQQFLSDRKGVTERFQRGLHQLPIDYGTRIRNFLAEYLGIDEEKVPFGGREDDLTKLDAWWQSTQSPSYALLVAEAGRGKSALLVHWAVQMTLRAEAEVIFIPISIRFQTNSQTAVFATLAARLSELHGEPLSGYSVHSSAETYHLLCSSLLERPLPDGKQLLIILDGLDEASDWQAGPHLFPPQLPARVKLIASARTHGRKDKQGWLEELHWRKGRAAAFTLPFLSRDGVADVLVQMGNPLDGLASELDVIGTLYHLSEGDPLLVRLYVEQLVGHVTQSGNTKDIASWLRTAKPGLEGYFDGWWRDQRQLWERNSPLKEQVSSDFFNLLAVALGPLSQSDIRVLLPNINTWLLEETVESLGRFVISVLDDRQTQSFTFSHPRLGYYFYERLDKAERQSGEQRFLTYGQSTLEALQVGELKAQDAPAYVIRYYANHLERTQAGDIAFDALVSQGWAEAWNALEGTYAGFLNDIQKVRSRAVNRQDIGMIIWCVLCQSSVTALSSNIDSYLLLQAVIQNLLTPHQAFIIAKQQASAEKKSKAISALAPHLPQALLAEALTAARAITNERSRAFALSALAPHLPQALLAEALTAARAITYKGDRTKALSALAPQCVPLVQQNWFEGYRLWYETVEVLAISPRPVFLGDLQVLMPFTLALVKEDERSAVAQKIAQAIIAVGKWLP